MEERSSRSDQPDALQSNAICHCCNKPTKSKNAIQCTNHSCLSHYCLICFSDKYHSFPKHLFNKQKKSNKWLCFKCKLVCNCTNCRGHASMNNLHASQPWFLHKKRSRIARKISKRQITHQSNTSEALNVIHIPIEQYNASVKSNGKQVIKGFEDIEKDFPNFYQNTTMNSVICKAAYASLSSGSKGLKKKSNKPCLLCAKFKCPQGVDIIKFKSLEDYSAFLAALFKEVESRLAKSFARGETGGVNGRSDLLLIFSQRSSLEKIPGKSGNDFKLKGPKRFCSNCLSNLFRKHNPVLAIYDNLKDEDEEATLELKKKLEIVNGIQQLIVKLGDSLREGDSSSMKACKENKEDVNIFNEIFSKCRSRKEGEPNENYSNSLNANGVLDKMEMFNDPMIAPLNRMENKEMNSSTYQPSSDMMSFFNLNRFPFFTDSQALSNARQLFNKNPQINKEFDSYLASCIGFQSNLLPMSNSGMNYQINGPSLLNLPPFSQGVTNNNICIDNIINPFMINQINQFHSIPPSTPNVYSLDPKPLSAMTQSANSDKATSFFLMKRIENLNDQLNFTNQQIVKALEDCTDFLSQYNETTEEERKLSFKAKLDEAFKMLQKQILISFTLLQNYNNELALARSSIL